MTKRQAFLLFATEYIGDRVHTFEEFREYLFEEILKKEGYDNTFELLLEIMEEYLRYEDDEELEEDEYGEF